jgi:uncharacterized protein (DUF849 family)
MTAGEKTMQRRRTRLKACLNGSRRPEEHPAIPITPDEMAAAGRAAVDAGADAVHMHPRGSDGVESLAAADIGAAVRAVRVACTGVPIGVSTGLWITGRDAEARHAAVAAWSEIPPVARPDFASVNVGEPGFVDLADALQQAGIEVEPGVWSTSDADALARIRPRRGWLRILVEVLHAPTDRPESVADAILDRLDVLAITGERLLHGEGTISWPLLEHAARLRLATRIGLEDVLVTNDGSRAADNAELVRLAAAILARRTSRR